jgi:glycosyltransferase involved in cell wall biosynthesis
VADDRLRILQVAPWSVHGSGTGGMAAVVRDLTAELRREGHHVDILANAWEAIAPTRDGPELKLRVPGPPDAGDIRRRLKWPLHRERAARAFRNLCRRERISVVHAHYAAPYLATLARARDLGGAPFVVTCHRGDVLAVPKLTPDQRRAVVNAMHEASRCAAVSRWLADEAEAAFTLKHVEAVPNGFRLPAGASQPRSAVEETLGRALPTRYAVMVGNMRPYKGHEIALDAWQVVRKSSDLPLVLVGRGPDFAAIRAKAVRKGVDERTIFLGHLPRETTLGVMSHATMVVAPSQNEGQGLFALEAGALGRPLVCSAIPPLLDIVDHGAGALTFPPDDPTQLAQCVLTLESDPELRARLAAHLKSAVAEEFSIERMVSRYTTLYRQAANT